MTKTRTYDMKRRAERQEETRQRIVEAAVELHTTLGPARTTVQAVAERAGVTRPTVYAHFPDARSLLLACSGHVAETTPPPAPSAWAGISDPVERLRAVLGAVYGYYAEHEQLLDNVQRDAAVMPVVAEVSEYRSRYLVELRDALLPGWPARGSARARLKRSVGHALEFRTWQSLVRRQGCSQAEAVELMVALAAAAAASGAAAARTGSPGSRGRAAAARRQTA